MRWLTKLRNLFKLSANTHAAQRRDRHPPLALPKCDMCNDTHSIIRFHDGRKISCPKCRGKYI